MCLVPRQHTSYFSLFEPCRSSSSPMHNFLCLEAPRNPVQVEALSSHLSPKRSCLDRILTYSLGSAQYPMATLLNIETTFKRMFPSSLADAIPMRVHSNPGPPSPHSLGPVSALKIPASALTQCTIFILPSASKDQWREPLSVSKALAHGALAYNFHHRPNSQFLDPVFRFQTSERVSGGV
jgi:hypothetical protein